MRGSVDPGAGLDVLVKQKPLASAGNETTRPWSSGSEFCQFVQPQILNTFVLLKLPFN
jgi:hypothetical protein